MESLFFISALTMIIYIIYWSLRYDGAKSISEQKGLIRMQNDPSAGKPRTPEGPGDGPSASAPGRPGVY